MKKALLIFLIALFLLPALAFGRQIQLFQKNLFSSANLKALWRMEGNSADSKGTFSGTDTNISYGTVQGKFGQGAANGAATSSKIVKAGPTCPISGSGNFSVFTWMLSTTTAVRGDMVTMGTQATTNAGLYLFRDASNTLEYDQTNIGGPVGAKNIADGNWHFVGVVNTGGSIQLWTDGATDGSAGTMSPNFTCINGTEFFDQINNPTLPYKGYLDDIQFYNVALTQSQIQNLYTSRSIEGNGISR